MSITIVISPNCQQCKIAETILKNNNFDYTIIEHSEQIHDDYPIVYMDNKRFNYKNFLQEIKK